MKDVQQEGLDRIVNFFGCDAVKGIKNTGHDTYEVAVKNENGWADFLIGIHGMVGITECDIKVDQKAMEGALKQ